MERRETNTEGQGEVGKRIIVPPQTDPKLTPVTLMMDIASKEVEIRLHEGGDKLDQLLITEEESI